MMSEELKKAMNDQLVAEVYSAYMYWSMASYLHGQDYPGMAHWMEAQAKEELSHAARIYNYLIDRGVKVSMAVVEAPPVEWDSPLHVMENVLEHEKKVTAMIHNLVDIAINEKDYATNRFLSWFVEEQVEEESSAHAILARMKKLGDDVQGLIMLDNEMASRKPLYHILPKD